MILDSQGFRKIVDLREISKNQRFRRRSEKIASLMPQAMNDKIVTCLGVHAKNPIHMWNQRVAYHSTVTRIQQKEGSIKEGVIELDNLKGRESS